MNGLIGLISLSALLLAVSGQLSSLSPSYSMQGTQATSVSSFPVSTGSIGVSVDIDRRLRLVDEITTTIGGVSNNIRLYSEMDITTYESVNNVCTESTANVDAFISPSTNVWDLYAAGTENPTGTYTYTQGSYTHTVTIVNGEPASFVFSFDITKIAIAVTNFDNTTPAFSTFPLPNECSQFTCSACYQPTPFPTLSPSYSLQGGLSRNDNGVLILSGVYSVFVDIDKRLQFVDETLTPISGIVSKNLRLSSENDSATYLSVNNVCIQTAFDPNVIFPLNTNVWDLYAAGTESPTGTFSFTQDSNTYVVTIVDGVPASFSLSFGTTIITIAVTNFDDTTPAFSTFFLPGECFQFTCSACYQPPPFPTLSPSYSFQGDLNRTENGNQTLTAAYGVSVDINRRLQFVDETVAATAGGVVSNNFRLSSENDSATYLSVNNVCIQTALNPNVFFPLNTNVWNLYAAGIEAPPGTFTFTQDSIRHTVTIVNEKPALFTFSFSNTIIVIPVSNFDDMTPAFSTFSLPSECSQFTCNACYQLTPFPTLSPSYSFQGSLSISDNGALTLSGVYNVFVDIDRRLQFVDETLTLISGIVENNLRLSSENDSATYLSVNNVCIQTAFDPNVIFPFNTNVWDLYAAGTESPTGTFSFTQDSNTYVVTIVDGVPASFSLSFNTTVVAIAVSNFDNSTPAFSTFSLSSECSQFTCNACYQLTPFPTLSPSYSLQGSLSISDNGALTLSGVYNVFVDIDRRLQFVDETLTLISGIVENNLRLSSENDSATYLSVNNVCTQTAFDPNVIFPLNTNVWDLYAAGTESPTGTFSFTQEGITYVVTITNGEPAGFTFSFNTTVVAIAVSNFDKSTPAFSTFSLSSECSLFTCSACYNSAVSVSISIMLLLTTLLVYLFNTL